MGEGDSKRKSQGGPLTAQLSMSVSEVQPAVTSMVGAAWSLRSTAGKLHLASQAIALLLMLVLLCFVPKS